MALFVIQDVIESYSAGHSDLVSKVKSVQNRLDVILGKPGAKVSLNFKTLNVGFCMID